MIHQVCAIRDSAMQAYVQQMFVPTTAVAARNFRQAVNQQSTDNMLYQSPEDYELWHIAQYDDSTGTFYEPEEGKRCILRAKDAQDAS